MTVKLGYGLDHPPMLKMNKSPADSINIILIYLSALESRGNDDEWMWKWVWGKLHVRVET